MCLHLLLVSFVEHLFLKFGHTEAIIGQQTFELADHKFEEFPAWALKVLFHFI